MKLPIKTLEANLHGSDYVIGDLHGSYSVFQNLLKNINFNPEIDRIISVGDLVDRGPDSLACLSLIRESWFHSVLGNHEQMMIEKFNGGWIGEYWYRNGGQWGMEAFNDYDAIHNKHISERIPLDTSVELFDLLTFAEELPFLITVNTKSGKKFHILHAELPSGAGRITDVELADPIKLLALATIKRGDGDAFLWSRNIFDAFYNADLSNRNKIIRTLKYKEIDMFNDKLSHIISGHTILQNPMTIVGQTNIDTGAYGSYWIPVAPYSHNGIAPKQWAGLTCVELDTWKFYQANENTFAEIEPFTINRKELSD